ncbi:MAG: penicillin-binding protein 1C [Pseudobdellovibrionaceae bacterium]
MYKHKKSFLTFLTVLLIFIFFSSAILWKLTPTAEEVLKLSLGSDRILLASNEEPVQTLRTDFKKRLLPWRSLNSFSKDIQDTVILAEDQRFSYHLGFDPLSLGYALLGNLQGKHIRGASTISMQLSDLINKDVLVFHHTIKKKSFFHKLTQIFRAVFLELKWSKAEILEAYLNLIHLRGELQGVPAVSYAYLHKDPAALDSTESLIIAAMISSPNQSSQALTQKTCQLYRRKMRSSDNLCENIKTKVNTFFSRPPGIPEGADLAPHLARRLFTENHEETKLVSTLDSDLQRKVIAILEKNIYRLKDSNVHDTAAIVIDNKSGQVLAYIGTTSSSENPHVDGVQAYRQAGSSLKPFIYAKAIETKTLTAASILLDDPTAISWNGDVYRPTNYDRHFYGPVAVREALGSSLNVPAVKVVSIIGLHQTYNVLQSIELSKLKEPDFYGVSMALGAVEVRLDELANAYRMLANGGVWSPLRFTKKELQIQYQSKRVFSAESAFIISSILSDPNSRAIGFGWESPLETPFWTAVKTGTSKDYRDNWCIGYSDRYTVGVWAGNFNAEAMKKVSGVSGVGPSWYEIMMALHNQERSFPPEKPQNIIMKNVRHQWAQHAHPEFFIKGTEPIQELIEPALDKHIQFVFPAEGSVLIEDPHLDQKHIALFVRFKGSPPEHSFLLLDGKILGPAASPFKIANPPAGDHQLAITESNGKILKKVRFVIQ